MVTLQILVLSFLVRIQVAQLKTTFIPRVVFFVLFSCCGGWRTCALVVLDCFALMQALCK